MEKTIRGNSTKTKTSNTGSAELLWKVLDRTPIRFNFS